jgi:hypothetical protein
MCQFALGNLVITEVLPTKSLGRHSQLGPKKIVNAKFVIIHYKYFIFVVFMEVRKKNQSHVAISYLG